MNEISFSLTISAIVEYKAPKAGPNGIKQINNKAILNRLALYDVSV